MEYGKASGEARASAAASRAAEVSDGDEIEAAEGLAGLACDRTESSQDPAIRIERYSGCMPDMATIPGNREQTVKTMPSQLCSTSYRTNSACKLRPNLNEVCKEAKQLRRILANRESARQTIRRREAMHMELARKASDLLEENENLKKKKENAVKEYTSLKGRNEFLKEQLSKVKGSDPGEVQEDPNSSRVEMSSSATHGAPFYLYNQPSIAPVFWPPILSSSDVFQFQCASHPDVTGSSGTILCSHQGQENSAGTVGPLFVLPVPWLLPFLNHSSMFHSHSGTDDRQNNVISLTQPCGICPSSDTQLHEENNHLSSNQNIRVQSSSYARTTPATGGLEDRFAHSRGTTGRYTGHHPRDTVVVSGSPSGLRPVAMPWHTGKSLVNDTHDVNSASEHIMKRFSQKRHEPYTCPPKKPEDAFAATMARRRRKELMKLKNVQFHHMHTQN